MKTIRLSEKLSNLIEIINNYTEVELIKADGRSGIIHLQEYDLEYKLIDNDLYFLEAVMILSLISMKDEYASFSDDYHLFSGYDLISLRETLREDYNHLGGVYRSYFYDPLSDGNVIRDSIKKEDVYKYIEFINKATSF
ncbi:hypothetical protein FE773_00835 [Caminibacter mediatlanticus TB-2]|uniref:Uncharacterized protein n=1 Tax=Caminibacter mediatlanticus TB-2 TaxID=391592 RepID=A0ABX5V8R4_9BACT|nr:hypothetical protein [Caminibacter mediatlanticus]QCT93772.1 hypothetical protein FE773_00835 [Caminibacter mediatlanticus TB-2]